MKAVSLVWLALLGEGVLVALALAWARLRGVPLEPGSIQSGVLIGGVAAGVLGLANIYLLCRAPGSAPVRSIRRLYVEVFKPLFSGISITALVVISVAAGLGEELFFRGVLQTELGLVPASVIFGVAHMGGTGTLTFGCWVSVIGIALGGLAILTDGLIAPIVAHTVYDAAAMSYIRWSKDCPAVALEAAQLESEARQV